MKNVGFKFLTATLLPLGLAALTSCSSGPQPEERVVKTADGEAVIDTYRIDATVTGLDTVKRRVTVSDASGKRTTFKARPDQDISRLQVGDRLQVTLTEEVAVSLRKADKAPPGATETAIAASATGGGDSVVLAGEQTELTSKITAIDTGKRKVTLKLPDGSSKTIKVSKDVDLSKASVGDDVVVQITDALAMDFQEK
jgi:hypothetical protein